MKKGFKRILVISLVLIGFIPCYAHGISVITIGKGKNVPLATAINIYARLGTKPKIFLQKTQKMQRHSDIYTGKDTGNYVLYKIAVT